MPQPSVELVDAFLTDQPKMSHPSGRLDRHFQGAEELLA